MEKKANLFIVGAMKAGTTSFNEVLAQHPDIYFSPVKEPHYFVHALPEHIYKPSPYFSLSKYLEEKFPDPLHIAKLETEDQYKRIFKPAQNVRYLAEGSTAYLHAPESPALIQAYNPDAKIIILVRDGLKRAFSHYKMDVGWGRMTDSFNNQMKANLEAYKNGKLNTFTYLNMSLYAESIDRYRQYFPDGVMIVRFEELIKQQKQTLEEVFRFLNIGSVEGELKHVNESANIRFKRLLYLMKQSGIKDVFSQILPVKWRHAVFNAMKKNKPMEMDLEGGVETELKEIFNNDSLKIK